MILNTVIVLNKENCYALSDVRSLPIGFYSDYDLNLMGKLSDLFLFGFKQPSGNLLEGLD